jgi:hypothetical protein
MEAVALLWRALGTVRSTSAAAADGKTRFLTLLQRSVV